MRRPLVVSLVLLALLSATPPAEAADERVAALDSYVARGVDEWEVPGLAIAVVKDGELVFAKGYGVRELGVDGAVDEHTLFAIGSTTKAMTAASVALMVDEGKVAWDDPVTKHLPGFQLSDPYVTREVTVRDLLTHRAGLGNADLLWYGRDRGREEILARVPLIEAAYSLRGGFVYQNIMYLVAGRLAGVVAGSTWEELVAGRLFGPLGMNRTVPNIADTETMDNVARPHDRIEDVVTVIENETADALGPAGTVWSSVSDMSRWLRLLLAEGAWGEQQILSEEAVGELLAPQTLLDLSAFYPAREKERDEKRVPGTKPAAPLESYAGAYSHPLFGRVEVTHADGALRLAAGPRLTSELEHWHYETFLARADRRWQGESLVVFSLDAEGRPARLELLGSVYERVPDETPDGQAAPTGAGH